MPKHYSLLQTCHNLLDHLLKDICIVSSYEHYEHIFMRFFCVVIRLLYRVNAEKFNYRIVQLHVCFKNNC